MHLALPFAIFTIYLSIDNIDRSLILAAYVIAVVMRVAQGSATVALVTAAGLMAPAVEAVALVARNLARCSRTLVSTHRKAARSRCWKGAMAPT